MGYLKQIDIKNFKSWRGNQIIGPFKRFNCIIGTNGSGKSNIMDALGFVMGERVSNLRVKHTRDLIHGAHIGKPVSGKASVTMRYCADNGEEINFCRSISGDSSDYRINGQQVTLAKYTAELEKIGIVVKARNCLVFQGTVESIAMMNTKDRTKMFERISNSLDLVNEYDSSLAALQRAKEDAQFCFNRKRAATAERKQLFRDKAEAMKYQALVDDLEKSKVQLNLFQLYHNQNGIETLLDSLRQKQEVVATKKSTLEIWEQAVKTHKKEHGRLNRELQQLEKEIRSQEQTLGQQRPQYIKAKVNVTHHQRKAEEARGALQKSEKQWVQKEQQVEELQREMEELEQAWRTFEREAEKQRARTGRDVTLGKAQLEHYEELKELARKKTAVLRQNAEKLHWELKADRGKLEFDQRKKNEVEAHLKQAQDQLDDLNRRAEKLEEYMNTCNVTLVEQQRQEESLVEELERGQKRMQEVNEELSEVLGELQSARMDSHESRRQQKRDEVLDSLKRLYPDVLGRLVDLCQPIHKKYQLAITKVFGHYMNAVVVASEKVARDCIQFLKEERAEPETFLPIDYLEVSPLNERLRGMWGAKMVVDVVQCSPSLPQVKKVLQFVCRNALVCETLKDAQHIAFDRTERLKTVALDGTMFSKSGEISGGSAHLRSKAQRWDDKTVRTLRERKEQLTAELRALMKLKRKEAELKQVSAHVKGVQTRMKYSSSEKDVIQRTSLPASQAEISRLESEQRNLESQIQIQTQNVEMKEKQLRQMEDQVRQIGDVVFSDFCVEIGVANIREYEQTQVREQQELDEKRLQFESQRLRLNTQLEYEQGQLEQQRKKIKQAMDTISKEEKLISNLKKEEEKLLEAVDATESKLGDLKNLLVEKKDLVKGASAEVEQKVKGLQETSRELVKLQKEVISVETVLEHKRLCRHNLLLACKIEAVPITLLSGSLDQISDVQLDSESPSISSLDIYEREDQMVIDYRGLEDELKVLMEEEEKEKQLGCLHEAVSSLEGLLQRSTAPNLKALEKMREVKESYQVVLEAFESSTKAAKKCHQEFEQVKAKRFRLFSQCFEHVSVVIDQIYKQLCRNSSAQAILSAENPDEPYLSGINYNCVAPGKRFMAMDNLSGGEKSVAALALVFAIHSFRPAPFFVLDEVDAALDNTNIGKVTSFIREQSRESFQVIAISLKEEFYSRADALFGVYSEFNQCMFSRVLSLDLTPYPLDNDQERETEM
ncbi:structural maintenance of chromosomes protein 1B [Chanos chanos]|uniref:Structural maintenance of chromosomes protein n=1 Tax=Chanos chanos TaxID=29144 RepID=A0A6J2VZP2_CHACN|nr:structural maintenance of chromosomes protein 1B-like [Chanos chanos]